MDDRDPTDRSIHADGLCRWFGDLHAVDEVNLAIPSGQVFGFLGPNGSGKSTTVKMLTTILAPTKGRAYVGGYDVTTESAAVRRLIGVALQDVGLDPLMTAAELLTLQARLFGHPGEEARSHARSLLQKVGLTEVDPKKRVGAYSGGMKRRLDLALALVHDPSILFLDEPTTGLDPASRVSIWEEVARLNRAEGMTIFLTTQYLEEADRLADEVAIINRGRIVAQGTPAGLKAEMGKEVVTLGFASAEAAARAEEVLADIVPRRQISGREVICYFGAAGSAIADIVRRLDQKSIALADLTVNPTTYIYDAMRSLLNNGWEAQPLLVGLGVSLAFASLTGVLALWQARQATRLGVM
jgi:ABC-2 type transport system ATP-binding protein